MPITRGGVFGGRCPRGQVSEGEFSERQGRSSGGTNVRTARHSVSCDCSNNDEGIVDCVGTSKQESYLCCEILTGDSEKMTPIALLTYTC